MDIKYAAGFIDGEGSIQLYAGQRKNGGLNYQIIVTVSNTNIEVLNQMKESFEGTVRPLTKAKGNCKQAYRWRVVSQQALSFLKLIAPYLIVKKEQANLAFQFQTRLVWNPKWGYNKLSPNEVGERARLLSQMHLLNHKGVA